MPNSINATTTFNTELWHLLFAVGHPDLIAKQTAFRRQGAPPRCKLCLAPFGELPPKGWSDEHPGPSHRNPRFCNLCDWFVRQNPGGAKVPMSLVFADVRDSTRLAEELPLEEYVRRINGFYRCATEAFIQTDGFMIDVIGDEVFALYPPGFSGVSSADAEADPARLAELRAETAARKAFAGAQALVHACQRATNDAFPFGVSVHTGVVYVGTVRGAEEGIADIRVWGAEVNKAARLCAQAPPGTAFVSQETCDTARADTKHLPQRLVELKGVSRPAAVRVLRAA